MQMDSQMDKTNTAVDMSVARAQKAEFEIEDTDFMNTNKGVTSRGSVKLVHTVISSLSSRKKDLINEIQFGGVLSFPQLTKLNLRFSKWLLSRVDESTSSIVIDKKRVYKFSPQDVHNVFGVPAEGRDVRDKNLDCSDAAINKVRSRLGLSGKEARSLKAAQAILDKEYGENMTQEEIDAFKTAFIVFMMGNFFAPTSKYNYCSIDYWPALVDPDLIHTFNWGKYIVEELCEAAKKLKYDIRKNVSVSNISGCSLFLQVFYLDSVNLGALNIPDGTRPLIKILTMDRLRAMIYADTVHRTGRKQDVEFGASLPKHPGARTSDCRKRASSEVDEISDAADWNNAKELCQLLKFSNEIICSLPSLYEMFGLLYSWGLKEVYQCFKKQKEALIRAVTSDHSNFCFRLKDIAKRHGKNKDIMTHDEPSFSQICSDAGGAQSAGVNYTLEDSPPQEA